MKLFYLLTLAGTIILAIFTFSQTQKEYKIFNEGVIITVKVIELPMFCNNKSSYLYVEFNGNEYSLKYSRRACMEGRYQVNDKIDVRYSSEYDDMVFQHYPAEFNLYFGYGTFLIPMFVFYITVKEFKKSKRKK